jgi:hypothetical protein
VIPAQVRTALTLLVLCGLLLIGVTWGWSAVTKPFPGKADAPICVTRTVSAGDRVYPQQVTVSVLNAGTREGLAGRTMQLFVDDGFGQGHLDNAPQGTDVARAEIWSADPTSPAVRLVASRLGHGVEIARRDASAPGVVVVVGDDFTDLSIGRRSVLAEHDAQICSPPVD